ncbi:MAG: hypothetical protein GY701_11645 [Sulfitobacter sp.]|nr:hypothetical protein [Sulfitobacter sp.]
MTAKNAISLVKNKAVKMWEKMKNSLVKKTGGKNDGKKFNLSRRTHEVKTQFLPQNMHLSATVVKTLLARVVTEPVYIREVQLLRFLEKCDAAHFSHSAR